MLSSQAVGDAQFKREKWRAGGHNIPFSATSRCCPDAKGANDESLTAECESFAAIVTLLSKVRQRWAREALPTIALQMIRGEDIRLERWLHVVLPHDRRKSRRSYFGGFSSIR